MGHCSNILWAKSFSSSVSRKIVTKNPMITASNINFAIVKCPKKLETCKINKNCKEQGPHSFFQAGPPVPKTAAVSIKESYFFKRPI